MEKSEILRLVIPRVPVDNFVDLGLHKGSDISRVAVFAIVVVQRIWSCYGHEALVR